MMHRQGERHEHHGTQAHDGHHGMHRHHAGHGMHGPRAGFMRHMDANRDGRLGRDEVLAAQQRQLAMFDRADADRDGALTRDEMRAAREAMREEFRKRRGGMHRDGEPRRPADPAPASVLPSAERGV
jgi:hypothetical protein